MFRDVCMSELSEANPRIEQQMRDWQIERHQHGANPFDWDSFRAVVSYIGASDPGEDPPTEFFWFTPPDGSQAARPLLAAAASRVPSARLVSPGRELGSAATAETSRSSTLTDIKTWR
jgi:hypothetical protein